MIGFKEFLAEARMAPLYHGTSYLSLSEIIKKGGIEPRTEQLGFKLLKPLYDKNASRDVVYGVSTTRNINMAFHYRNAPVVLVLDQQKLTHNYEIKPIQYWQSRTLNEPARNQENIRRPDLPRNEYEEFILSNKLIPLRYIKEILYKKPTHQLERDYLDQAKKAAPQITFTQVKGAR